jgi:hypothetical protein
VLLQQLLLHGLRHFCTAALLVPTKHTYLLTGHHVLASQNFEQSGFACPVGSYQQAPAARLQLQAHVCDQRRTPCDGPAICTIAKGRQSKGIKVVLAVQGNKNTGLSMLALFTLQGICEMHHHKEQAHSVNLANGFTMLVFEYCSTSAHSFCYPRQSAATQAVCASSAHQGQGKQSPSASLQCSAQQEQLLQLAALPPAVEHAHSTVAAAAVPVAVAVVAAAAAAVAAALALPSAWQA